LALQHQWKSIDDATIEKTKAKSLEFWSQIETAIIPIKENGINEYKVEELWTGPASYGGPIDKEL